MTAEEEIAQLKKDLAAERAKTARLEGELAREHAETACLRQMLEEVVRRLGEIEGKLAKDSHNSSKPPSSDGLGRKRVGLRKKSGKKAGGQPGHLGQHLQMVETPDQVISHGVESCPACQHDLREVPVLQMERRQVVELPPKRVAVIEHQAERKCCPACQEVILAPFPADVRAPVQYGHALGALAVYLVQQQLLPYERVSELFFDLYGHPISPATIVNLVQQCAEQLTEVEQQIKTALSHTGVLHQDETGLAVAGKRHWVHVSATPTLTHYAAHPKRGKEALEAIGILPNFQGVSVHDGWRSYWAYVCQHATCNVHLVRDLTFLAEELHQDWAA